jgi:hypothetical protein
MPAITGTWSRIAWLAVIVGVGVGLFDLGGDFVIDDSVAIEQSVCVTGPLKIDLVFGTNFWCEQTEFRSIQTWRPWTVLAWWFVWRLGPGTVPFTLLNLALSAACIRTVYDLGRDLGISGRAAALGALVFAPLAIHVDAVAPAVGAAELWSALFVLLSVRAFLRGSLWCVPAGVLAILSKESGVLTFAWIAAAFVLVPGMRSPERRSWQAVMLALLGACTLGVLAWRAEVLGGWLGSHVPFFVNPMVEADAWTRTTAALSLVGRYHRITLLGGPLSADYAHAALGIGEDLPWGDFVAGVGVVVFWGWLWWYRRAHVPTRVLVVWILGTSLFVSNALFVLPAMFAERLFYLPSAAVALLGGLALERLFSHDVRRPVLYAAIGAFVVVQAVLSSVHTLRYGNEAAIVRHTVETTPRNARARMWLALQLVRQGDLDAAEAHVEVAGSVRPNWGTPRAVKGVLADLTGQPEAALIHFRAAMQLDPQDREVADLFIQFLLRHGHVEAARAVYQAHAEARGRPDPLVTVP